MTLKELEHKLKQIKKLGYVGSLRKGNTGIGFTFESLMGLQETNIPVPDIGGRAEIKTTRRDTSSLVTLFTFNRGVWQINQKELIKKFGYTDDQGRRALKSTIFYNKTNSLGFSIQIDDERNVINLYASSSEKLAEWDTYVIVGKFATKLSRLVFVLADREVINGEEKFNFNEAYLLTNPQPRNFLSAFKKSLVGIDLRMHIKENDVVRNRGIGFRMKEKDMIELYADKRRLI